MDQQIYFYVKIAVIIEIILVISFVFSTYTIKLYTYLSTKKYYKTIRRTYTKTKNILIENYQPKNHEIKFLKKNIRWVLSYLNYHKKPHHEPGFDKITSSILEPIAKKYKNSHFWYKRYLTTQCLKFNLYMVDDKDIKKLLQDPTIIVSLNITEAILNYEDSDYINIIIDHYAQGRHLQQSLFSQTFNNHVTSEIVKKVYNRLDYEKDDYIRIFCYRILAKMNFCAQLPDFIHHDLVSKNIDLVIATLKFVSNGNKKQSLPILRTYLQNPIWQIRAACAKLLGRLKDTTVAARLAELLSDKEWWVRINSAVALSQLGRIGLEFLEAQTYEDDKYAYDAAQNILTTYLHNKDRQDD